MEWVGCCFHWCGNGQEQSVVCFACLFRQVYSGLVDSFKDTERSSPLAGSIGR